MPTRLTKTTAAIKRKIGAAAKWIAPHPELIACISKKNLSERRHQENNNDDLIDQVFRSYLAGFTPGLISDDRPHLLSKKAMEGDRDALIRIVTLAEMFAATLADLAAHRPELLKSLARTRST